MSRRCLASLCLFALGIAVCAPSPSIALAAPAYLTTFERSLAPGFLTDPSGEGGGISGNRVVYAAARSGNTDIYCYDLSTGVETRITDELEIQFHPAILGDMIVWEDFRDWGSTPRIYSYNLSTHVETLISKSPSIAEHPQIWGRKVVWQADHDATGHTNIYIYDLDTGVQSRVSPSASTQVNPSICGDNIVWQDDRNGAWDVYFYRMSNGALVNLTSTSAFNAYSPSTSGSYVVWLDTRDNGVAELYGYNIYTGNVNRITNDSTAQNSPHVSGSKVVWNDSTSGNPDIYLYDFVDDLTAMVERDPSAQTTPFISGADVIWQDQRTGSSQVYYTELNTPRISASLTPLVVSYGYGGTVKATGTLTTPGGRPIAGGQVRIEISPNGDYWLNFGTAGQTDASGRFTLTSTACSGLSGGLRSAYYFRVDYLGGTGHLSAQTVGVAVKPHAQLGAPHAPATMQHNKAYTVWGTLAPQHQVGSSAGSLLCYRLESGRWKLRKTVPLTTVNDASGSRYSASVKLTLRGVWRMRAKHSDSGHFLTYSSWRKVTVN